MKGGRALQWVCWVLLALWLMTCPLLWILRDGLGPDATETTGRAAVQKFLPVRLTGLAVMICLGVLRRCERRHTRLLVEHQDGL